MNSYTQDPPNKQRAARLDRIYRRISRLDDDSLVRLDQLTAAAEADDAEAQRRDAFSRRGFLLTLLLGSVAAAGGGTALLLSRRPTGQAFPTPTLGLVERATPTLRGDPLPTQTPSPTTGPAPDVLIDDLRGQLAAIQGERLALRAQLDSARSELDAAQAEVQRLTADLQDREQAITTLRQAVALYQQMDDVGLDEAVLAGMGPVGLALLAIQGGQSLLAAGIQQAAALLATVEAQSPGIANGLLWLEEQVNNVARALQDLEDALSDLVEPVAPVAQQIGDFIGQVLDALPFGAGAPIRAGLQAVGDILTHIPELVASINPMLITPLRQWVSPDEEGGLVGDVVRPISANLISPAQSMVESTDTLLSAYQDQLQTPVEQALAVRAAIREQLATLRQTS